MAGCAVVLLGVTTAAAAQTCGSKIVGVNVPVIALYQTATGPLVGSVTKDKIPLNTAIIECHENLRMLIKLGNAQYWLDGFSVRTDAKAAKSAGPIPGAGVGATTGTVRGMSD
jgi:hypothetical protein